MLSFWESLRIRLMEVMADLFGEFLEQLDQMMTTHYKEKYGWKSERLDSREFTSFFGTVSYKRHLMYDRNGNAHYPVDEAIGLKRRKRYSPDLMMLGAELAAAPGMTYRLASEVTQKLAGITISHTTFQRLVKEAGEAQAVMDAEKRDRIFEDTVIPNSPSVKHLYCEADGLYVKGRGKGIEIKNMLAYTGWEQNGQRVSLTDRHVFSTVESVDDFWEIGYAAIRHRWDLSHTHVATNADAASWISEERVQNTFSEATSVVRQLDPFHVKRSIRRGLSRQPRLIPQIEKAISEKNKDRFKAVIDTAQGNAETEREEKRIENMQKYLEGHWEILCDWREVSPDVPKNARRMGCMESNQRRLAYRMKRRGMYWSEEGAQAIAKVQQGVTNGTLRQALLTVWPNRQVTQKLKRHARRIGKSDHIGVQVGRIQVGAASASSAIGYLDKVVNRRP
ncbi:ISLre2 family transposase [Numidum massiliense]|uniref:ISLre2 family transposase n=2 Tax=Numidum massiliense TaxID=1522315 RepID=UPI00164E03B8|nr:ISLre2 family transposase [Numidum massiliense]